MREFHVIVTEEHVRDAVRLLYSEKTHHWQRSQSCPVALALKDAGIPFPSVGKGEATCFINGYLVKFTLTEQLSLLIDSFDRMKKPPTEKSVKRVCKALPLSVTLTSK